jgi:hypothetical protein
VVDRKITDQQEHPYQWFSTYSDQYSPAVAALFDQDDSPGRRAALGHAPEPDCPGYCTCGDLCTEPEPRMVGRYWSRIEL